MNEDGLVVLIAGIIGGLIGIGAAVFSVIYAFGIWEYLGGKKKSSLSPSSAESLKASLLALNAPDKPFEMKTSPETDFIIEWKIADAKWFAFFGKERLKETYRAYLLLDDSRKSARYCEELVQVRWFAGTDGKMVPVFNYHKQFFRGRILYQKTWAVQYGIKEDLTFGKVYEYKYDIREMRNPIRKLIIENGWEFVPVVSKKHATYERKT